MTSGSVAVVMATNKRNLNMTSGSVAVVMATNKRNLNMTSGSVAVVMATIALVLFITGSSLTWADDGNKSCRNGVEAKMMTRASHCGKQVLVPAHRYRVFEVRSKAECAVQCGRESDCVSIVYDKRRRECHLGDATAASDCGNMESASPLTTFYQEPSTRSSCEDGKVKGPDGTCVCPPGHSGTPCKRGFHDCYDILDKGGPIRNGVFTVHPVSHPDPFQVYCKDSGKYLRMYVMKRLKMNKHLDFNRPWQEYKDGFGDVAKDHWLGLDKIYALTSERNYNLRISIVLANGSNVVHTYRNFKISDGRSGYRLSFNTSFLNYNQQDDCLFPLLDAKFSAYDHDEDEADDVNCAQRRKGGFWFRGASCSRCNPHGIFYLSNDNLLAGTEDEVFWQCLGTIAPMKLSATLIPY